MDFVPCKLHGDDLGDNTVTTRWQPRDCNMCREDEELEPKQDETITVSINGPIDLELGLFYNRPNGPNTASLGPDLSLAFQG